MVKVAANLKHPGTPLYVRECGTSISFSSFASLDLPLPGNPRNRITILRGRCSRSGAQKSVRMSIFLITGVTG